MDQVEPSEWHNNPSSVLAVQYMHGVIRASNEAGMKIEPSHFKQAYLALINEINLPKIRVFQLLNKLTDAVLRTDGEITITAEDARVILQAAKDFQ